MTTESAMYMKVRDFVVSHWKAADAMTKHDSGPDARGEGIQLSYGGIRVEPDVFGVVVSNTVEVPILGEGKRSMGGHVGTHAFAQALTYRNLGMLAFLFFPESEFDSDAATTFKAMCAQAGIGLLKVPDGRRPIDPKRHVVVECAGGSPTAVATAIERTLMEIKGVGQHHLADVYPTSLRDVLSLFEKPQIHAKALERRFLRSWKQFAAVLSARPYDPMVGRKIRRATLALKREYLHKFARGLLALGFIAPTIDGYRTTDLGEHLRLAIGGDEPFGEMGAYLRRLFAFAVMREFEEPVLTALNVLRRAGRPLSSRSYCKKKTCGESDWRKWQKGAVPSGCPTCGSRAFVPAMYLEEEREASSREGAAMTYALRKFACAVGILESRTPRGWREDFPRLPTHKPSGDPISWNFYWTGDVLR